MLVLPYIPNSLKAIIAAGTIATGTAVFGNILLT